MTSSAKLERPRPPEPNCTPVPVAQVFDDPDSVLSLIRQRAPYRTIWTLYGLGDTIRVQDTSPWFREDLRDDLYLNNPAFIFEDPTLDLEMDQFVDIYLEALNARGIRADRPDDPHTDTEWRWVLQEAYPSPFGGKSAYQ